MRLLRLGVLPLLLLLAGCVATPPPAAFTPLAPGMARIVFYRVAAPYDPTLVLTISLNNAKTGTLPLGGAFYRDVTPGPYTVTFTPTRPYPDQFTTVTPSAGNIFYVRLFALPTMDCSLGWRSGSASCDISGFIAEVVSPAEAQAEMRGVALTRG
jgi:hypothetical protein